MMASDHFIREKQGRWRKYTPKWQAGKPYKALESGAYPRQLPSCTVSDEQAALVANGRTFTAAEFGGCDGPLAVLDAAGTLLAVYEPFKEDLVKPAVVLLP